MCGGPEQMKLEEMPTPVPGLIPVKVEAASGVRIEDMRRVTEGRPRVLSRIDHADRLLA